jgi:hypothetical protein
MRCVTQQMSIGKLWTLKNRIDVDPPYQREAGLWSPEKKQLFMDSILNQYDVPKLYFHDRSSEKGPWAYSVIDGKQRLTAIWDFMGGKVALAEDFKFTGDTSFFEGAGTGPAASSSEFTSWNDTQKEYFKNQTIDVVHVLEADEDDIEELFSRLNNGEPLNAAEKRNAMGGDMIQLVRTIAKRDFLKERLGFNDKRMSYHEVAAKLLRLKDSEKNGQGVFCDLKKKHLDSLVKKNKAMPQAARDGLLNRVDRNLRELAKVFTYKDPLLSKQSYPQLYYGWIKQTLSEYTHQNIHKLMHDFLERFHADRLANLQKPEEERDSTLIEYGRLMQQGTNDLQSMQERARILTRYFLLAHPDVALKDKQRSFTDDERYVIWITSGKQCQAAGCGAALTTIEEMEADHVTAWSKGGPTTLANAQALCISCNKKKSAKAA